MPASVSNTWSLGTWDALDLARLRGPLHLAVRLDRTNTASKRLVPTVLLFLCWVVRTDVFTDRDRYSRLNITTVREARMNLTRVYLIYGTLNKITYRHRAKYEQIELFSYLGGFIGIWIGVSFLNVLEYGTQATTWLYHKYKERKSRRLEDADGLKVKPISVRPTNGFPAEHW
ncbi:hypothetical protein HPB50_007235 [Hyalomma asiaticum]|uniref:Uncharacterized protein n=1 Tax=Hyalomma asiaticum TaxID=266040 RepID=A0ACB7RIR2_HYAAI|nr:hypothetical protein HPB50_007235 [Hyalomma asiaticum]